MAWIPFASAQQTLGSLNGTVTDTSGAAIPKAVITVTNVDTGAVRKLARRSNGTYSVHDLPVGSYRIAVRMKGFAEEDFAAIQLQADRTLTLNAVLKPDAATATIARRRVERMRSTSGSSLRG